MQTLTVRSQQRQQMIDVTREINNALAADDAATSGFVLVSVPHTTAAVTINENADPDVTHDLLAKLSGLIPHHESYYRHAEGNSDAHLKSSLVGASILVPVENGRLFLGTWQGVYFCEFDGPRTRKLNLQIMPR